MSTEADQARRPWYRRVNWEASFWVVFLLFLMAWTASTEASSAAKAVCIGAIVVFIGLYVYTVSTMGSWDELPPETPVAQQLRPLLPRLALLAIPAAVSLPVLGWSGMYYLPYLCAILLFGTHLSTGLSLTSLLCAGGILSAVAAPTSLSQKGMAIGCRFSCVVVVVSRIGTRRASAVAPPTSRSRRPVSARRSAGTSMTSSATP